MTDKRSIEERLEEFEIEIALGTKTPNHNVIRIHPRATEIKVKVLARVHQVLRLAETRGGTIRWKEIPFTRYSSGHVAFIEAAGLMLRRKEVVTKGRPLLYYDLTDVGRKALTILNEAESLGKKMIVIPIEINYDRYMHHMNVKW